MILEVLKKLFQRQGQAFRQALTSWQATGSSTFCFIALLMG